MVRKIALEEHFLCPGFEDYWRGTVSGVNPDVVANLFARLNDFGDMRLEAMDGAGIARAVLSISGPGVQAERDVATARRRRARPTTFWRARSRSVPTAIPVSPISPCRTRRRRPTNSNVRCAS